jgi:hypothetical protein
VEVSQGFPAHERFKAKAALTPGASVRIFHPDAMSVPIDDLLDEEKCYRLLLEVLPPKGLRCPAGHPLPVDQAPIGIARLSSTIAVANAERCSTRLRARPCKASAIAARSWS